MVSSNTCGQMLIVPLGYSLEEPHHNGSSSTNGSRAAWRGGRRRLERKKSQKPRLGRGALTEASSRRGSLRQDEPIQAITRRRRERDPKEGGPSQSSQLGSGSAVGAESSTTRIFYLTLQNVLGWNQAFLHRKGCLNWESRDYVNLPRMP